MPRASSAGGIPGSLVGLSAVATMSSGSFSRTELTTSEIPNTVGLNGVEADGPGNSRRTPDERTLGRFTGHAIVGLSAAFTRALFTTSCDFARLSSTRRLP